MPEPMIVAVSTWRCSGVTVATSAVPVLAPRHARFPASIAPPRRDRPHRSPTLKASGLPAVEPACAGENRIERKAAPALRDEAFRLRLEPGLSLRRLPRKQARIGSGASAITAGAFMLKNSKTRTISFFKSEFVLYSGRPSPG